MNKYQKKLNKEVKEMIRYKGVVGNFRQVRKGVRFWLKRQTWSPCEDCDNCHCDNIPNKLFYCKDNR